jgi:hypothetical protein
MRGAAVYGRTGSRAPRHTVTTGVRAMEGLQ